MVGRRGITLVELLVTISIIGVLMALLLPAVQSARISARRAQCASRLRQIGVALQSYHDAQGSFPSGHVGDPGEGKTWGWAALLLPHIEQTALHDQLNPGELWLLHAVNDERMLALLRTPLPLYRCPAEPSGDLSHEYRQLSREAAGSASGWTLWAPPRAEHVVPGPHPDPDPPDEPPDEPPPPPPPPVRVAVANYVGNFGNFWAPQRSAWGDTDFQGNGLFGRNSHVTLADVSDGTSFTLAVGERSWKNYAGVWPGTDTWDGCGFFDNQMVLATAFYRLNTPPAPVNLDCDGTGSAGFSSRHGDGANFVFADGSVRWLSADVDFNNGPELGTFQRLAQRNDGRSIEE